MSIDVPIERDWCMPDSWTFEMRPFEKLLSEEMDDGLWIDPFAGNSEYADLTNDLNPEIETDYTMRATEFLHEFDDEEIDGGVLFDPPFSPRQIKECYDEIGIEMQGNETQAKFWSVAKDEIMRITQKGAKAICFGWNSVGISEQRGFRKKRILMVCHGGNHNDTICTVETKETREKYDPSDPVMNPATEASW